MSRSKEREAAMDEVRHLILTEGIKSAARALIGVCNDEKAAGPAKATAGSSLFRAAGLFDKDTTAPQKEIHEMSSAEMSEYIAQLERDRETAMREMEGEDTAFD